MKLIDADELMEHVWRDKLDSRELIAKMIEQAPPVKEIPIKISIDILEKLASSVNPQLKIGYCKECRWWKDSDGVYRRGVGAESHCPINNRDVFEGNGYCYMFAAQERRDEK